MCHLALLKAKRGIMVLPVLTSAAMYSFGTTCCVPRGKQNMPTFLAEGRSLTVFFGLSCLQMISTEPLAIFATKQDSNDITLSQVSDQYPLLVMTEVMLHYSSVTLPFQPVCVVSVGTHGHLRFTICRLPRRVKFCKAPHSRTPLSQRCCALGDHNRLCRCTDGYSNMS